MGRIVPGWAKAPRMLVNPPPQPKPGATPLTSAQQRARAEAERLADPAYQADLDQQEARRLQNNRERQERINATKPVLIIDVCFEDGSPVTVDGRKVIAKVLAQDVSWAIEANQQWFMTPDSKKAI